MPNRFIDRLFGTFWRHLQRLDAQFDLVVCANPELTKRLRSGRVVKAETIPMGVEPGVFSPRLRSVELRNAALESLGLSPEACLFIGVGRLSAEKRWEMAIAAVSRAGRDVGLLLVGDGLQRRQLEKLAARAGNARVIGPIALMASADALVHGCEAETFCMVAAEARASGIPLIVPDRGAAPSHVVPGAGLLYGSAKRQSLEAAMRQFADQGHELQRMRAVLHSEVRTMDVHFEQLFERYALLGAASQRLPPPFAGSSEAAAVA